MKSYELKRGDTLQAVIELQEGEALRWSRLKDATLIITADQDILWQDQLECGEISLQSIASRHLIIRIVSHISQTLKPRLQYIPRLNVRAIPLPLRKAEYWQ